MSWVEGQETIYSILDFKHVRHLQILVLFSSTLVFSAYALFLDNLCANNNELFSVLLLVSIQVVIGVISTKALQIAGGYTAQNIDLIDPGSLAPTWISVTVSIPLASLDQVFNQIIENISENRAEADDVLDFAWFVVIVWSVVSSASTVLFGYSSVVCILSTLILVVCSAFCYCNGYSSGTRHDFDEDLEHLRYYVLARVSHLYSQFNRENSVIRIRILSKNNLSVLYDIGFSLGPFKLQKPKIVYWIGLSCDRPEAIEITLPSPIVSSTFDRLRKAPILRKPGWSLVEKSTDLFLIAKDLSSISISSPSSYVGRATEPLLGMDDIVSSMKFICKELG